MSLLTPIRSKAPTATAESAGRRRELRGIHWAVTGFLAGTVFWHLVGFWDFVGRIVFSDSGRKVGHAVEAQAPPAVRNQKPRNAKLEGSLADADAMLVTGSIAVAVTCVELLRDADGATSARVCEREDRPFKPGNFLRRGDRAAVEAWVAEASAPRWSTTVTVETGEARVAERN